MTFTVLRVYLILGLVLFCFQNRFIFFAQKIEAPYAAEVTQDTDRAEEVRLQTPDKVLLHGWLIKNSTEKKSPLLIYFGGNAEEVSSMVSEAHRFTGYAVLLMNYRGYGLSQGKPNERNLSRDAEIIYDHFSKGPDIDGERIVLMGRSLGSGIAVHLGAKRKVKGVILVTPYDSMVSVAQEKYPFFPISWMLLNRFDSMGKAPNLQAPLLALVAAEDKVIPPWHARRLARVWGGPVKFRLIEGAGHNTIQQNEVYWRYIDDFLKSNLTK